MPSALIAAAGFASAWMLLWAAAAAIPIVLHFLFRRRQRTISWAAMQLLLQVVERESKRIRIEQILLLMLRTAILIILAIALSRPFWRSDDSAIQTEDRSPATTWILAIDVSYSMNYRVSDETRLQTAQQRATELIEAAQDGDAFALVSLGRPTRAVIAPPTFDRQRMLNEVQKLAINDAGCDAVGGLQLLQGLAQAAKRDNGIPPTIRIVILSDLGRDHWESVASGSESKLMKKFSADFPVEIDSLANESTSNLAIVSVRPTTLRALVGRPLEVDVTVANFSSVAATKLPVQLEIDEQTVASEFVDLEPGTSAVARLKITPRNMGRCVLTAAVPSDRLPTDNRRSQTIEVGADAKMLFVEQRKGDSRVVGLSLQPDRSAQLRGSFATVSPIELSRFDLNNYQVVVLNDLSAVDMESLALLKRFVEQGGALLCLWGPRTEAEFWNSNELAKSLLGFEFLQPSDFDDWQIDPLDHASPVTAPFAGFPDAGLLTTPIFRFWNVKLDEEALPRIVVDLQTTTGKPLILRHRVGQGSVASLLSAPLPDSQSALAEPTAHWNAIATWPSFVPLMQALVQAALDSKVENHTRLAGEALSGRISANDTLRLADTQTHLITIAKPDGSETQIVTESLDANGELTWTFLQTQQSGVYSVRDTVGSEQVFAVNVDPSESELESIQATQFPTSFNQPAPVVSMAKPRGTNDSEASGLTSSLLMALGVLLLAESGLAWFLGRRTV